MRFLGAWLTSLTALALVAALILGRTDPPRTYDLAAIEAAFEDRYAAALADLEAGAVLYLRTELRFPDSAEPARVVETWVGTDSRGTAVARSEESFLGSPVFQMTEIHGARQAILDLETGEEANVTTGVVPVEPPATILQRVYQSALGSASGDGEALGTDPIVGDHPSARVSALDTRDTEVLLVVTDPLLHIKRTYESAVEDAEISREVALVDWQVLPAGTPLGTRS